MSPTQRLQAPSMRMAWVTLVLQMQQEMDQAVVV
jgi:hypothetical protein